MPLTSSLRHCSNKYKLAREGEKEKDEDLEKVKEVFWGGVMKSSKEMSFQLLLEDWQGSSIPDGGGGGGDHSTGQELVKENVLESDYEPLCDGTTRRRSLADLRLLEGV